jgi:hypothetical protein
MQLGGCLSGKHVRQITTSGFRFIIAKWSPELLLWHSPAFEVSSNMAIQCGAPQLLDSQLLSVVSILLCWTLARRQGLIACHLQQGLETVRCAQGSESSAVCSN